MNVISTEKQAKNKLIANIIKNKYIYLLLLPGTVYFIIFSYYPMYGITLAFKQFQYNSGILFSPWIGLQNFKDIFVLPEFWSAFTNTITISLQRLLIEFPVPIILALLLNEVISSKAKRFFQTVYTFPNFLSWVVVSGIVFSLLSDDGSVNHILIALGYSKQSLLMNSSLFRPLLYVSSIWKSAGWSAIIYLAAITSINPELYESAIIDGAGRFKQMRYITWPEIRGTVSIMLILAIGNIMNAGFDQIFNMYNAAVYNTADIIDTYIYRRTFQLGSDFGTSTAIGLFKSVINAALLFGSNFIVKKLGEEGLM
jgi:putative aldouronate transport system permease protein